MSHVDDPAAASGPPSGPHGTEDDAFADGVSALLGSAASGTGRSMADERFAPGAEHDVAGGASLFDDDEPATRPALVPDADVDLDAAPLISWADPIAEAEADRLAEEEAREADRAARAKPIRDTRGRKRNEWRQTERARRYAARRSVRFPIFTRSVLLWMLIFAIAGLAFGASGAFWWAQFNTQIQELKEETRSFEERSQNAQAQIDAERNQALTQIKEANKPLAGFLSEALIVQLARNFQDKAWYVTTKDDEGKDIMGSAFAVASGENETLMVASYNTIKAATLEPGPEVHVLKLNAGDDIRVDVWAWDPASDLALLRVPRGNLPVLEWAPSDAQAQLKGARVFMISGWGAEGATLSPGLVIDVNASGIRHNAQLGPDFQGGPIIAADGKVVGVASMSLQPGNFDPGELKFASLIDTVCGTVMNCGGGDKKDRQKRDQADPKLQAPPPGAQD